MFTRRAGNQIIFLWLFAILLLGSCTSSGGGDATAVPEAPTGVTATAGDGQVTIAWNAVTGATSYNLYWSNAAGAGLREVTKSTGTQIAGVTSPYVHTGLTPGIPYCYVVTAVNAAGESADSAEVCVDSAEAAATPLAEFCGISGTPADTSPFTLVTSIPPNLATDVNPAASIVLFFDDVIQAAATLSSSNVTVVGSSSGSHSGTFTTQSSESGNCIAAFTPSAPFSLGETVTVTITSSVLDDDGNSIDSLAVNPFSFTIASSGGGTAVPPVNFEGGTAYPAGVACLGDCAILNAFGDAPPATGTYAAYISSGDPLLSLNPALDGTTSVLTLSNVATGGLGTLRFTYNFISDEFDFYVGTEFDDVFLVTVSGPNGAITRTVTSVNIVGTVGSTAGSFPGMFAEETGNQTYTLDVSGLGSPLTVFFTVSDVGDMSFTTVVMLDDIAFQ